MSINPDPVFSDEQELDELMLTAMRLWSSGPRAEKRTIVASDQAEIRSSVKRMNADLVRLIVSGAFRSTAVSEVVVPADPLATTSPLFAAMHRSAPDTTVTKSDKDEMEKLVERDRQLRREKGQEKPDGR